jgi:hypothetical protein
MARAKPVGVANEAYWILEQSLLASRTGPIEFANKAAQPPPRQAAGAFTFKLPLSFKSRSLTVELTAFRAT